MVEIGVCTVLYRMSHLMNKWRLELFFAIWFVLGIVWVFESRFGSFHEAPKLHVVCIILLAWNAMCYSFHLLLFVLLCCCVPLISTLLGYNMNMASSDDQISQLPSWRHKEVKSSEDPVSGTISTCDQIRLILLTVVSAISTSLILVCKEGNMM